MHHFLVLLAKHFIRSINLTNNSYFFNANAWNTFARLKEHNKQLQKKKVFCIANVLPLWGARQDTYWSVENIKNKKSIEILSIFKFRSKHRF